MDKYEVCVPDHRNHGQAHVDNVDCVAEWRESMQYIKDSWLKLKMPTLLKMLMVFEISLRISSRLLNCLNVLLWSGNGKA